MNSFTCDRCGKVAADDYQGLKDWICVTISPIETRPSLIMRAMHLCEGCKNQVRVLKHGYSIAPIYAEAFNRMEKIVYRSPCSMDNLADICEAVEPLICAQTPEGVIGLLTSCKKMIIGGGLK